MPLLPNSFEPAFDKLHARARANAAWQRLAVVSRVLLALAFVPTGMVRALGRPFTTMGTDTLVGQFFDVMWRTGGYWRFIGITQIVAGILLLVPRTALLGALLFLPIILNIFVITIALRFQGTPFITGPMLLAAVFLICWDYPSWKRVIFPLDETALAWWPEGSMRMERLAMGLGASAGFVLLLATRGLVPSSVVRGSLAVGVIAGMLVLASWLKQWRTTP